MYRFVPKRQNGVRPIVSLSKEDPHKHKIVTQALLDVKAVLDLIVPEQRGFNPPSEFGFGISGWSINFINMCVSIVNFRHWFFSSLFSALFAFQ